MIPTTFSPCRTWRYTLWRELNPLLAREVRYVNFICLNPSTADETRDDPTVRRCVGFAKAWGYDGLYVTNIFAYRSTDPKAMKAAPDAVGRDNDRYISAIALGASLVITAWGQHGRHLERAASVKKLLRGLPLHYLRVSGGEPHHPLYLPKALEPIEWEDGSI